MTRKAALILCLVGIVAVSGIVLGQQQAARKSTIAVHLAAAETALAQGDYQGAVKSFEAAFAAGVDPAGTQARLAQAQAMAYDVLARIPKEGPTYEQAHQFILPNITETQRIIASMTEGWNVAKDPEAGRFVLTSAAAGTATFPATILSPGFLLVQRQHLWRPPGPRAGLSGRERVCRSCQQLPMDNHSYKGCDRCRGDIV